MQQDAYDSLVGKFLWLGIPIKYALKCASLLYPEDEIYYKENNEFFSIYAEDAMDLHYYKYDVFDVNETFPNDVELFDEVRRRGNYSKVRIYLDGANLLRSYAFIKDKKTIVQGVTERDVSINIKTMHDPLSMNNTPSGLLCMQ